MVNQKKHKMLSDENVLQIVHILGGIHKIMDDIALDGLTDEQKNQIKILLNDTDTQNDIMYNGNKNIIYYDPKQTDNIIHIGYSFNMTQSWANKYFGNKFHAILHKIFINIWVMLYVCIMCATLLVVWYSNCCPSFVLWMVALIFFTSNFIWYGIAILLLNVSASKMVFKSFEFWFKMVYALQMISGICAYQFKEADSISKKFIYLLLCPMILMAFIWAGMFDAANIKRKYKLYSCVVGILLCISTVGMALIIYPWILLNININ